jgi:hypothetical protein
MEGASVIQTLALALLAGALPAGNEPAIGKLGIALGAVEAKAAGQADFSPLAAGAAIEAGMSVRTGKGVRGAIDFADGSEFRLDEEVLLVFDGPRKLTLLKGQIYARIAEGAPFLLHSEFSDIFTAQADLDLLFSPRVPNTDQLAVTRLFVFLGKTEVKGRRYRQEVSTGYTCSLLGTQLNTPDNMGDPFLPTVWMHPILVARGAEVAPEVDRRVRGMVSRLARTPENDPFEAALKSLGDASFAFIGQYLSTPSNPADAARRIAAARVMGEAATAATAAKLLPLLDNELPEVRVAAAKGLARVAGTDLGSGDAYWKGEDRAAGLRAWEAWVSRNAPK